MTLEGFFSLETAADLRKKLERDLQTLRNDPASADAAFNFFVTALHILDWRHPGRANNAGREAEEKSNILLQVTSHLGNGAKHFKVEAKKHATVSDALMSGGMVGTFGGAPIGAVPIGGAIPPTLYVELDGTAAVALGPRVTALELAEKVMAYWSAQSL